MKVTGLAGMLRVAMLAAAFSGCGEPASTVDDAGGDGPLGDASVEGGPDAPPGCDLTKDPKDSLACVDSSVGIFVDADSDNRKIRPVVMQILKPRSLLDARCAPAGPEIEQHHFAAISGQVHRVGPVVDGKIGRNLADLSGTGSAVAAGQKR